MIDIREFIELEIEELKVLMEATEERKKLEGKAYKPDPTVLGIAEGRLIAYETVLSLMNRIEKLKDPKEREEEV